MATRREYKYKRIKTNRISLVVFGVIFLYVIICIYISSKNEPIIGYEVKNGTLSENRLYSGIALRKENIVNSPYTGYVNYFVREGERAAYNNLVYCIDESGKLSDSFGKNPTDDTSLSKDELKSLKQDIMLFSKNFDTKTFSDAKVFEDKNLNMLSQIENRRIIEDVNSLSSGHLSDRIEYCRAKAAGIVTYYQDGFENKTSADLSLEDFDIKNYSKVVRLNDELIEADSFAYKYTSDEKWILAILVPQEEVAKVTSYDYVEVNFIKNHTKSWGRVTQSKNFEKYSVVELEFTNSMVSFVKDRFVDIELMLEEDNGLKVPNSSIAEKAFYLIDKSYVTKADVSNNPSVLRREYDDSGEHVRAIEVNVYKEDDDVIYVDKSSINYGDVLIKPETAVSSDNSNTYVIGKQGTLTGVYNINKGYADFNRIEILYSNDEYSIISPSSTYGLRAYDHIALDASIVSDKDFVY